MLTAMVEFGAKQKPSGESSPIRSALRASDCNTSIGSNRLTGIRRLAFGMLRILPKNALSRLAGRFACLRWPGPIQRAQIRLFAWATQIDLEEARDPVEAFDSLQQFFTRALAPDARPIQGDGSHLVSPCDGAWGASGRIEAGRIVQIKGVDYSLAALLADPDRAATYEGGSFATFYLSPRDYHRFHTPAAGRFTHVDYRPGALWPVNAIGLGGVDGLFARNERICAFFEVEDPSTGNPLKPPIALVPVGATIVGCVRLAFDELHTNVAGAVPVRREYAMRAPAFSRGEEWGHFEFGSTIVLLAPPRVFELESRAPGTTLRLGESIGRIRGPG